MSEKHKDKVVSKAEVVRLLQLWESKGHGVMSVVRVFTLDENRILIGFTDYQDYETVVFAEHMYKPYANYQGAFTALGAIFDALDVANAEVLERVKSRG
jgi:hypothetical protein